MANPVTIPDHVAVYSKIRDLIMFGEMDPGQAVTIASLQDMADAGMTPVREAIRQLTIEGALVRLPNRRVAVPGLSRDWLEDLYVARLAVEPLLCKMASERMRYSLVPDLEQRDADLNIAIETGSAKAYLQNNHAFHFRFYEEANSAALLEIATSLWLQLGPSLRVMHSRFGSENLTDFHKEAMSALQERDHGKVQFFMEQDIRQGMDHVLKLVKD
jgi:DNA-binding GntR family transcriptional regulator